MTKDQKVKFFAMFFLIGIFFYLLAKTFLHQDKSEPMEESGVYQEFKDIFAEAPASSRMQRELETSVFKWGRDPFQPVYLEDTLVVELAGIMYDPVNPSAIINGDIYYAGDQISGFTVESVGDDHVILKRGDYTKKITMNNF